MHIEHRRRRTSPLVWMAVLAGAFTGAVVSRSLVKACSCSVPTWQLSLQTADAGGESSAWPTSASLEARPGTVVVMSMNSTTDTIDYLHAGEP